MKPEHIGTMPFLLPCKERPILFSASMVRALLDGNKTQTRRVVKPMPLMVSDHAVEPWTGDPDRLLRLLTTGGRFCPYGSAGDRLWVRETWAQHPDYPRRAVYRANPECRHDVPRWTPAIHMFRWASRITLEVNAVRVERLQDISEADAIAEGSFGWAGEQDTPVRDLTEARLVYRQLWEQINGPGSWEANPWVWVVKFRKAKA